MADMMTGLKRTVYCGDIRPSDIGREVVLAGWCAKQRNLGNLVFIDLRDRSGIAQLAFDDTTDREIFDRLLAWSSVEFYFMGRIFCSFISSGKIMAL